MNSFHTSKIEISKSALKHNIAFFKSYLKDGVILSSVVKGNAYGHGIETYVPLAERCGIKHFSVFSAQEALRVKNSLNKKSTIMIMGFTDDNEMEWAINNGIEFYVFQTERLKKSVELAKKNKTRAIIHLEVETGMNRTGLPIESLAEVIKILEKERDHIIFKGLCTHFAGAENIANYVRIKKQQQVFRKIYKKLESNCLVPELRHTACSAASLRYPNTQMDMVRVGIALYGYFPTREVWVEYMGKRRSHENPLKRLITWKSKVADVKWVKAGEFVGYGMSFLTGTDVKIAIIPVGYSHGFSRNLSNHGRVLIKGQRISVISTINMSMIIVDVTQMKEVNIGDEVILIGNQGDLEISVSSFSDFSDQINYELLTRLPGDIPREVVT